MMFDFDDYRRKQILGHNSLRITKNRMGQKHSKPPLKSEAEAAKTTNATAALNKSLPVDMQ
jgi:hypothetical protein